VGTSLSNTHSDPQWQAVKLAAPRDMLVLRLASLRDVLVLRIAALRDVLVLRIAALAPPCSVSQRQLIFV
jgi:hypothetical protein